MEKMQIKFWKKIKCWRWFIYKIRPILAIWSKRRIIQRIWKAPLYIR